MSKRQLIPLLLGFSANLVVGCIDFEAFATKVDYYGFLTAWWIVEDVPAVCPAPQIECETLDLSGLGTMVRITADDSFIAESMSNDGRIGLSVGPFCSFAIVIDGEVRPLSRPNSHTYLWGLNDVGDSVGAYSPAGDRGEFRAALWRDGELIDLTDLSGPESGAYAVNNAGVVVGRYGDELSWEPVRWDFVNDAWTMTRLGENLAGYATDVNDIGEIIGTYFVWPPVDQQRVSFPFLWKDGELIRLPDLGGPGTGMKSKRASAINNMGWIVGTLDLPGETVSTDDPRPPDRAVLWTDEEVIQLGTLGGRESWAIDVNDSGQIVGSAQTGDGQRHTFLWQNGMMRDLNEILPPTLGITLTTALAINNRGEILCETTRSRATGDLILLIPSANVD